MLMFIQTLKTKTMDSRYQPIYNQAASLQSKFQSYAGASSNPMARSLQNDLHALKNDLAMSRAPGIIDNRIRTIQTKMRQANTLASYSAEPANFSTGLRNPGVPASAKPASPHSLLNTSQHSVMHSGLESMRQNIIKTPNFK